MSGLNDIVKAVHKAYPSTRIDTKLLLAKVWEAQGLHLWGDQVDILKRSIISPPASILRASQRVQQAAAKRLVSQNYHYSPESLSKQPTEIEKLYTREDTSDSEE